MQATLSLPASRNAALGAAAALAPQRDNLAAVAIESMVESADLLQGKKTVAINHNGAIYRLQATKLGKLILTK